MAKKTANKVGSGSSSSLNPKFYEFLHHPEKRVLMLKGKWGVGKTYAWKKYIDSKPELEEYAVSYVSLFGLKDINEIKEIILQKAAPRNIKQLQKIFKVGIPILNALKSVNTPFVESTMNVVKNVSPLLLQKFLICFDDVERKSSDLPLSAIFGLISVLKEENNCRVVLILNEDQILGDNDKNALKKYREKVVDQEIAYEPLVANNLRLIFKPDDFPSAQQVLVRMGINNIRIIKFVYWHILFFQPQLASMEEAVKDKFFENVAVLTSIFHLHGGEINIEDVPHAITIGMFRDMKDEKLTEAELFVRNALYFKQDYDALIGIYLRSGDCDPAELKKILISLNERERKSQTQAKLAKVWNLFNGNFLPDADQLVDAFQKVVKENWGNLGFGDLKPICDLFTALGSDELAKRWLADYVDTQLPNMQIEALEFFKQQTNDSRITEKIVQREKELQKEDSLKSVIYRIVQQSSWSPKDEAFLNSFSEDDYFNWFVLEEDQYLMMNVRGLLRFGKASQHSESWKSITAKVDGALNRVADRNPLDKYRVRHFFAVQNLA